MHQQRDTPQQRDETLGREWRAEDTHREGVCDAAIGRERAGDEWSSATAPANHVEQSLTQRVLDCFVDQI